MLQVSPHGERERKSMNIDGPTRPTTDFPPGPVQQTRLPKYSEEVPSFEWINVEEKNTTSRVKIHVRRELHKRQKAAGLQYQRRREGIGQKLLLSCSSTEISKKRNVDKKVPPSLRNPVTAVPSPALLIGASMEPFNALPAELDSHKDVYLIYHYRKILCPEPFERSNTDYGPIRHVTFDLVIKDPASFLLIIAGTATDVAVRLGSKESPEAIGYRAKAMTIINQRMMTPNQAISDGTICACAILGGTELLWGNPQTYNLHMNGLCQMINLRGGYIAMQADNPLLASLIACRAVEYLDQGTAVFGGNQTLRPRYPTSTATSVDLSSEKSILWVCDTHYVRGRCHSLCGAQVMEDEVCRKGCTYF